MSKGVTMTKNIKPIAVKKFAYFAKIKNNDTILHNISNGQIIYENTNNRKFGNHIETSGFLASSIISYGHDYKGNLKLLRHVVFPSLRTYPNDTHSSLSHNFKGVTLKINGKNINEKVEKFVFDGILKIYTTYNNVKIERLLFTSRNNPCLIEQLNVTNDSDDEIYVNVINNDGKKITHACNGNDNKRYVLECTVSTERLVIKPRQLATTAIFYCGINLNDKPLILSIENEINDRLNFLQTLDECLTINTPDKTINTMCKFAKIRACESIFKTKNGLMHSPGGGGYYAALWTNDQCEYINPLFAYLGYKTGYEQAINCYTLYKNFVKKDKALITSIIAEGDGYWNGAGDRGDSAMYAYGLSRFLLSSGDKSLAEKFLQSIKDCLDYTILKTNEQGVVESDSDELENRFESGKANLSTSCIAYDAMLSFSYILEELGNNKDAIYYREKATKLKQSIENYFGKNVEGYDTYRYCAEENKLRSWICIPLTVNIFDRKDETIKALFSNKLNKGEGLVTRSGNKTFWDRSTLYALRGAFYSGENKLSEKLLTDYSIARTLARHIPYAVEAYPEGNQSQLSAESGLYLRIFTEGILGYRPLGFNKFSIKPTLPYSWDYMEIRNFYVLKKTISIKIRRTDYGYKISSSFQGDVEIKENESLICIID